MAPPPVASPEEDMLKAAQRLSQRTKHLLAKRQKLQDEMLESWWEGPTRAAVAAVAAVAADLLSHGGTR